jgi:hypothetical protein
MNDQYRQKERRDADRQRWVRLGLIAAAVVVLLIVVMLILGGLGGGHGPSRHG